MLLQSFPTAQVRSLPTGVFPAFAHAAREVECRRPIELLIYQLVSHFNAHTSGLREVVVYEPAGVEVEEREDEEHVVVADAIDDVRKHKGGDEVNEKQDPVGQRVGAGADVVRGDLVQEEVADGTQAELKPYTCVKKTDNNILLPKRVHGHTYSTLKAGKGDKQRWFKSLYSPDVNRPKMATTFQSNLKPKKAMNIPQNMITVE